MDEPMSWKGHAFTLLVFGGIVVLCSIFFVLGMLVGRTQGQRIAAINAEAAAKAELRSEIQRDEDADRPELTFFDAVRDQPVPLEAPPTAAAPDPGEEVSLQVGAFRSSPDAVKLRDEVRSKGFPGFIVAPQPGDPNPFYRVQVGPISQEEAEAVKQQLESAGYQPIIRR